MEEEEDNVTSGVNSRRQRGAKRTARRFIRYHRRVDPAGQKPGSLPEERSVLASGVSRVISLTATRRRVRRSVIDINVTGQQDRIS